MRPTEHPLFTLAMQISFSNPRAPATSFRCSPSAAPDAAFLFVRGDFSVLKTRRSSTAMSTWKLLDQGHIDGDPALIHNALFLSRKSNLTGEEAGQAGTWPARAARAPWRWRICGMMR